MGKKKNAPVADKVRQKRKGPMKKNNPFEVKINKQKHNVLGRKVGKFEKGMPGVSRSKATKRRKNTLLKEYEQQFKNNKFVDKRFGEQDASLTLEDKMMKRFAMERSRSSSHNKFSLNDEEELTHFGQSLADIEKFDEPNISDDEEDDDDKRAAAKLVAEQHFGGFMKKKDTEDDNKSWKERMEEIIGESKKKKFERQMEKEKTTQMTVELDEQWKSLHSLLNKVNTKGNTKKEESWSKADDYDIAVRSLKFELKGQATDRLKTEDELAKEEKEKLEKLEADRIRRMRGLTEADVQPKLTHRSADDLDDGFSLEPKLDYDYVSYKDGQLLQEFNKESKDPEKHDDDDDSDDDGSGVDDDAESDTKEPGDDDDDDDDESDDGDEVEAKGKKISNKKVAEPSAKEPEDEDDDNENDDDENDDDDSDAAEDDYEDLESDDQSDDDDEMKVTKVKVKPAKKVTMETKQMMEDAKKELPYTFDAPASYEDLLTVLEGHDLDSQLTIIERIRKCHHPSLAEGNKQKLETLFEQLVQFYCDLCIQDPPQLEFVDKLVPHLYLLTQMSPENSAQVIATNMSDRQEEFAQICRRKAGRGLYPGLDTMLLFKLVCILFPTSDFRHSVTTPAILFMCQILGQSPVNNGRDIVAGLFMCSLCLEYITMSKRYIPEAINFLHGMLFYASDKEKNKIETVMPPFKPVGENISLLHISSTVGRLKEDKWSLTQMLAPVVEDDMYTTDTFRLKSIEMSVSLLSEFSKQYGDLRNYKEIFAPVIYMCRKLPTKYYPESVKASITELLSQCEDKSCKPLPALVMQKRKPKPLKMFEPKIDEKFDGRKKGKRGTRDFNEKQKLLHKHKTAMKGAMRELKKDTKFLARQKLNDQMAKDEARKRKVREIMGGLAHQEGEYKKLKLGIKDDGDKAQDT